MYYDQKEMAIPKQSTAEHIELAEKILSSIMGEFQLAQQNEIVSHLITRLKESRMCVAKEMLDKVSSIEKSIEDLPRI